MAGLEKGKDLMSNSMCVSERKYHPKREYKAEWKINYIQRCQIM